MARLETRIEKALWKWKKESRLENGSVVQVEWQFEQSHIILDVFWHDKQEKVVAYCMNPHLPPRGGKWKGLTNETITNVMDKINNFAQIVQEQWRKIS